MTKKHYRNILNCWTCENFEKGINGYLIKVKLNKLNGKTNEN